MHDIPAIRVCREDRLRRVDLAGAAHLELVSGVIRLRPQDAMGEAMLRRWRAQQTARGLREETIAERERLVRQFMAFTNEYPWRWTPAHVDEWSMSLTSERHLAPATIRAYQGQCGSSTSSFAMADMAGRWRVSRSSGRASTRW